MRAVGALWLLLVPLCGCGTIAKRFVGGTVESLGVAVARDDDPDLIRDAMPIGLKLMEAGLVRNPGDADLLLSACRGYTQYAQAFVAEPADRVESADRERARRDRERAGRLFLRARGYCLQALDARREGTSAALRKDPATVLARARRDDAALLYWTGASWAGAINVSRSDLDLVADLRLAHLIVRRANDLDPAHDGGSVHELLVSLEAALAPSSGGSFERAREHCSRAGELSGGRRIGALVALAESVSVKEQDLAGFRRLLDEAVAFDVESAPELRLVNTLSKRRAAWLLTRTDDLFVEVDP